MDEELQSMSPEQLVAFGYAVGVYEGEGTCTLQHIGKRTYARLVVRMTDWQPVEAMKGVFGGVAVGPYSTPYERAHGAKVKYRWTVSDIEGFARAAKLMLPYLSFRRQAQIQVALDAVMPRVRAKTSAGNKRAGELPPYRPRKTGELVCPAEPEPSARGYQRHRLLGIPCCDICRESFRLYYAERRKWNRERVAATNREQYVKNREARILQAREYRARKRQEGEHSEITG